MLRWIPESGTLAGCVHLHVASPLLKCNTLITALGLDKNCLAKLSKIGSQTKEATLQGK